ncbi:MAG: hypothetical protein IPJ40_10660 [Saprospirales bacterium]|nr:hypothetical protein [Saprospirales bacterium]
MFKHILAGADINWMAIFALVTFFSPCLRSPWWLSLQAIKSISSEWLIYHWTMMRRKIPRNKPIVKFES